MVVKETDTRCMVCLDVPASSLISSAPTSPPLVRSDEIVVMISLIWEKYCYSNVQTGKCKEIQKYSSECFFFLILVWDHGRMPLRTPVKGSVRLARGTTH